MEYTQCAGVAMNSASTGADSLKKCRRVSQVCSAAAVAFMAIAGLFAVGRATAQDLVQSISQGHTATPRFGGYFGVPDLWTPSRSLQQIGVHAEFGIYLQPRLLFGGDYSRGAGTTVLTTASMPTVLRQQLDSEVDTLISLGLLPAGYVFRLPMRITTDSFSAGPQAILLQRRRLSVFANPTAGALREEAIPFPKDALQSSVTRVEIPSGHKIDWTPFYGGSGGVDLAVTHTLGLRTIVDITYSHPFNDLAANGVWTYRFSTGISFRLGRRRRET